MNTRSSLAIVWAATLFPVYGQLYLIEGSTTPKYNLGYKTSLLRVGAEGSLQVLSEVLPGDGRAGGIGGTDWIGFSYDDRKAVFLAKPPSRTVVVLDLASAAVAKMCAAPPAPAGMGAFPFEEWLADIAGKGLVYVEHFGTADVARLQRGRVEPGDDDARGMLTDPSVPCEQSFIDVAPGDDRFMALSGQAGVADLGSRDMTGAGIDTDGALWATRIDGERTYLGYKLPAEVLASVVPPVASLVLSNASALGVMLREPPTGRWHLLVFRKADGSWHVVPGVRTSLPFVRGFGSFLSIAETQPKTRQNPESAGRGEWRKTETATGPSVEESFKGLRYVLPGKLHLYDVATEKMYSITTNQGDSEILLVDNNTVYYRVSDRLYSAAIGQDGLGPAKLLSTSESIRDVHWAFIKH